MISFSRLPAIALAAACIAGCATRENKTSSASGSSEEHRESPDAGATKAPGAAAKPRGAKTPPDADLFKLPAFEVKESAFSDFGMSVKTNLEVKFGDNVEWMFVIGVNAGSSAAKANLKAGDRILAIEGRLVTELNRDAMLAALFQRKKGDRAEFLLLQVKQPLPRFVTLVAQRPGP